MRNRTDIGRREFIAIAAGAAIPFARGAHAGQIGRSRDIREMILYIGTYTSGETASEGIYIYSFDPRNGSLSPRSVIKGVPDPSFLAIDRKRKYLFAVNELLEFEGKKSGAVSAFAIDQKTGDLKFINRQPSLGGAPCHISVSDDGRFVLVANYLGGNVAVLPVGKNGELAPAVDVKQHSGSGPNKERQEAAHAHSVILDRNNRFAFVNDLGVDKIAIYKFNAETGKLAENEAQPYKATHPGAGPRHFKFHPNGRFAFVINELDMTVSSFEYDERRGTLAHIQTLFTVPPSFAGENTCADVHVSPNGAFLYASNRGHDSIAAFRIDQDTGRLGPVEHTPTGGRTPRNFMIDPTGAFLLAANQRSNNIVVFWIDPATGKLAAIGKPVTVPSPVCLKMIPAFG